MAEEAKKAPAPAAEKKGGAGMAAGLVLVTAVLSGGASFAGAKFGSGGHGPPAHIVVAHDTAPGPTIALDPFIVTIPDATRPPHVVKATIAIELKLGSKEEEFKPFVPRIRDAVLTYLRSLTYEEATSPARFEHLRTDLKERIEKLGAAKAERVLVTDFVTQ